MLLTRDAERAADLAQSTCVRALDKHEAFTPGTHLDRWIFVMARRLWLNDMRKDAMRRGVLDLEAQIDEQAAPLQSAEMNIFQSEVLNQITLLPEAQRVTVILVYVEGYSYAEVAEMLSIPIGTVMSRLANARRKVKVAFSVPYEALK